MAALDEGGHCDGVVFRIREGHLRLLEIHQRDVGIRVERIAANQTVIPNSPNVASAACRRAVMFWCRNRFATFYVADPEVDVDFTGIKTGEFKIKIDVQIKDAVQLDRQQVCIPCGVLSDLVVREAISPHLRFGQMLHASDRHRFQPKFFCCPIPSVSGNYDVFVVNDDGDNETISLNARRYLSDLLFAVPFRIAAVGPQIGYRQRLYLQEFGLNC
nr:hypothetical protein [Ruegeria arenilitoris]